MKTKFIVLFLILFPILSIGQNFPQIPSAPRFSNPFTKQMFQNQVYWMNMYTSKESELSNEQAKQERLISKSETEIQKLKLLKDKYSELETKNEVSSKKEQEKIKSKVADSELKISEIKQKIIDSNEVISKLKSELDSINLKKEAKLKAKEEKKAAKAKKVDNSDYEDKD